MGEIIVENMRLERISWRQSMGKQYAFVTVEDLGVSGKGFPTPHIKQYWGEADVNNPESLKEVMLNGGKWENLP